MEKEVKFDTERKAATDFENLVANVFGTQRIRSRNKVVSGSPDVSHDELFIRCNRRKEISVYKWYDSAADESPKGKIPLVAVKSPHKSPLVLMDLNDFVQIYQASDEELLRENRELKEALKETRKLYSHIETVEQRRKRIHTYPYVPFGKQAQLK
jgi:hypothetical protein